MTTSQPAADPATLPSSAAAAAITAPAHAREIPFSRPSLSALETRAVATALRTARIGGNGPICKRVQQKIASQLGVRHALLVPNATQAMEMGLLALGIGPGDEVLMPSFAFVSQANAILQRGATPVFCEIDPATMNMDAADAAKRVGPRTKLVMPVHYGGVPADLDALGKLAADHKLALYEDAAQAFGSTWNGKAAGAIGRAGCVSFHETKNVTSGEGGALLTNDDEFARRCELIQEKGTNRAAFLRGEVDKYTWVSPGGSYVLSDLLAALLEVQVQRAAALQKSRLSLWQTYYAGLADLEQKGFLKRPLVPAQAKHNAHTFWFRTSTPQLQRKVLAHLNGVGIQARFHFQPLHASPYAKQTLKLAQSLPITEREADCLVRLPLHAQVRKRDAQWVVEETRKALAAG
jgi:dTDP-4-amino-4,6-dideoxygalactose transaminase